LWGPTYARIYQTSCNHSCYKTYAYGANNNNIYNNNLNYNYHRNNYNSNNYNFDYYHNNHNHNNTTLY